MNNTSTHMASESSISSRWLLKSVAIWALFVGIGVFGLTLYGVVRFYSPVPWWDEWDGYIGFYRNLTMGFWGGWWIPHMEHRLLLPRALFWLDIRVFGGMHYFLFFIEQAMLAAIAALVWREYARGRRVVAPVGWLIGYPLALIFSWVQSEVLKWGFEVQVIAAYLFAVAAAAQFSRLDGNRSAHLYSALFLATVAEVSMGNGMVAFVMLGIQGMIMRRPLRELLTVALWGGVAIAVYFFGYESPHIPHPPMSLLSKLRSFLEFFLVFLGNPLAFLAGDRFVVCFVAGFISLSTATAATLQLFRTRQISSYRGFLIAVYGFVVLSALAATTGRGYGGAGAAVASRYTTGPLLAWVALVFLLMDVTTRESRRLLLAAAATLFSTVLAVSQTHVVDDASYLEQWKLAVLAHKVGLDRPELDALLFPGDAHDHFVSLADFAADQQVALYGKGWLRDAGAVHYSANARDDNWCHGWFDAISDDSAGFVAKGWVVAKTGQRDLLIVLANESGTTIGYGLSGQERDDVTKVMGRSAKHAGWTGFLRPTDGNVLAYAYRDQQFCYIGKFKHTIQ
ncbi:membrane hypothetical protein [Paraburkholderia sabiae]|uniref:hypothetical protein n=1 Tax=Paraburkholderia sabiae TaxID=273251 RepID=UPI001CAB0EAC|nr:hypothetical protein [Paraburkholderia sabiae]CAG9213105.1 membrane hypothetical protein [Paraburkholderia sabiae]